jgi:hypothetical protein
MNLLKVKLACLLVLISTTAAFSQISPINLQRQSEPEIRERILKKVPLGSSVKNVETFIASQGWKQKYNWQGTPSDISEHYFPGVKGGHIIGADLGRFRGFPWGGYVDAFWGFDSRGKLIDLHVRKGYDAL